MRALRRAFYRAVIFSQSCQCASQFDARLQGNSSPALLFAAAPFLAALRVLSTRRRLQSTALLLPLLTSAAPLLDWLFPPDLRPGEEPSLNTRSVLLLLTLV
ncbi:hypothetical protein NDU88_007985 [Pleurodeles waltl]|uniref:Uncharacterized protein n=1 Tax=Pleurodeles waltl TaxID=8319 RepID=A0AAV7VVZ0_PLEWA|nr:hypothetical protein NDU88_007985 [Pleurodeles waltl]